MNYYLLYTLYEQGSLPRFCGVEPVYCGWLRVLDGEFGLEQVSRGVVLWLWRRWRWGHCKRTVMKIEARTSKQLGRAGVVGSDCSCYGTSTVLHCTSMGGSGYLCFYQCCTRKGATSCCSISLCWAGGQGSARGDVCGVWLYLYRTSTSVVSAVLAP